MVKTNEELAEIACPNCGGAGSLTEYDRNGVPVEVGCVTCGESGIVAEYKNRTTGGTEQNG